MILSGAVYPIDKDLHLVKASLHLCYLPGDLFTEWFEIYRSMSKQ